MGLWHDSKRIVFLELLLVLLLLVLVCVENLACVQLRVDTCHLKGIACRENLGQLHKCRVCCQIESVGAAECHIIAIDAFHPEECLPLADCQQSTWLQVSLVANLWQELEPKDLTFVLRQSKDGQVVRLVPPEEHILAVWPL